MILVWIRNVLAIFVIALVVYLWVSTRDSADAREAAQRRYDRDRPAMPRTEFIDREMLRYRSSFRARLIKSIFLLPILLAVILLYLANRT